MLFKRNQVEEAISRAIGESSAEPSATLKARLKRLLDVDRKLATGAGPRFAFYAKAPEGKGAITLFSFADACALFIGMRMLEHGWPQNFVVSSLRPVAQICLVATKQYCVGRSSYEKRRPKLEKWSLEDLRPIFF